MNVALELHDSQVLEVVRHEDGSGYAILHAYVYKSEGVPKSIQGLAATRMSA